jgi:hypothetical protein
VLKTRQVPSVDEAKFYWLHPVLTPYSSELSGVTRLYSTYILGEGPMPLSVLDHRVPRCIEREKTSTDFAQLSCGNVLLGVGAITSGRVRKRIGSGPAENAGPVSATCSAVTRWVPRS